MTDRRPHTKEIQTFVSRNEASNLPGFLKSGGTRSHPRALDPARALDQGAAANHSKIHFGWGLGLGLGELGESA